MGEKQSMIFNEEQRLVLHQLRLLEWLNTEQQKQAQSSDLPLQEEADEEDATIPRHWQMTRGVSLYDWQKECMRRWFDADNKGTVKVVTGGGKTLLGLAIAEQLQNSVNPRLRVAIVVPTVVLMHQWYDEILEHSNLPPHAIARLGGGYKEDLKDGRRILIAVLASARKQLARLVRSSRNGKRLLLIADECHRAGAALMSNIFETERAFSLGLSATPEREEDEVAEENAGYDESLLGQELGPIIYDFTLAQALELGVIPPFSIQHYGLQLNANERSRYDQLSRAISDTQSELRPLAPAGKSSGPAFFKWLHSTAGRRSDVGGLAARFVSDISRRQGLIQGAQVRGEAVEALLKKEFANNPDGRAILFHESIDEVMALFLQLHQAGYRVIAEHSRLPDSIREEGLNLFRKGIAQVIVSAKSLIEGFNVPAVDVGIIVSSSSSVRQRIQSLGRVLRRHRGPGGEEKTSSMHILYVRNTVDEQIYSKIDWERTTGVEQNLYYHWDLPADPLEQSGPPRRPLPSDVEVDVDGLKAGDMYSGEYEGKEYSCDTRGNIQDGAGSYAKNPGELPQQIIAVKGQAGRFRVTPSRQYILVRVPRDNEWMTLYIGRLEKDLDFTAGETPESSDEDAALEWAVNASPGDIYPFTGIEIVEKGLRFKLKRGGVISRRITGGEAYARTHERATDTSKGQDAETLIQILLELRNEGVSVSQLELNKLNHILFRKAGVMHFAYALKAGFEFPD